MRGKFLPGIRFGRVLALSCVFVLAFAQGAGAATASTTFQVDPAHDGIVTFSKPFAPPLKKKWSINLGGTISYPIVSGSLVIVLTTGPVGTRMVAINAATGKINWQKLVDGTAGGAFIASDNDRLFLATAAGPFQAFDAATGHPLWSRQLPDQLYFNFIPVAAYGYVYTGGDESGTDIYELNEATGALRWRHLLIAGGVSPTLGDQKAYMPIPCNAQAYQPGTGAIIWNYAGTCEGGGGAIAPYYRQRLYLTSSTYTPGIILDASTGKTIGTFPGSAPTFIGSISYAISGISLAATNMTTGNLRWSFSPKDTLSLPPIVINGNIYTLSNGGTLYVNAGGNGQLLQSIHVGLGGTTALLQAPSTGLGAGDDLLFVPSGNVLAAFAP
jgi:outer membrane protein assembly factor BamB